MSGNDFVTCERNRKKKEPMKGTNKMNQKEPRKLKNQKEELQLCPRALQTHLQKPFDQEDLAN